MEFELKLVKDIETSKALLLSSKTKAKFNQIDDEAPINTEFDEIRGHKIRLKCLFERAIAENSNCLDESLWLKYIYYLVSV